VVVVDRPRKQVSNEGVFFSNSADANDHNSNNDNKKGARFIPFFLHASLACAINTLLGFLSHGSILLGELNHYERKATIIVSPNKAPFAPHTARLVKLCCPFSILKNLEKGQAAKDRYQP
jgi:hypothetical protein